ncbi:PepSY-associated TM helix domain-containing protein [Luteibacter sp. 9135]|uniref:PepSY-associated TM helix domain-containing protein n=1 Tax=Luteibacter sp. 9135 TaxID=1500893 RepID=UPI000560369A|nr:PepSY-associated TM helix domain-containing protein [Luteibacter sp. 9135]
MNGVNGGLRQSMAWLHTWAGLLVGWLLLAIFATGTSAYFQDEITRWMQPEITGVRQPTRAAEGAVTWLNAHQPGADSWSIALPGQRAIASTVYWRQAGEDRSAARDNTLTLDGNGQPVVSRPTLGGAFLYRMHFDLHYMPVIWARWVVGFCAMFMLVAIVSGVITHKKIFADFFTLRFGKGQRSWLDAHNVSAVLALPFHLMITFTGLVTLQSLYMPWGVAAAYPSKAAYFAEAFGSEPPPERSGQPAPMAPLAGMIAQARAVWGGAQPGFIDIALPGDRHGVVRLFRSGGDAMDARAKTLLFDAATGRMHPLPASKGGASATESTMVGLHAGRYAPYALRWLYFLCSLAGTLMVATGLVLWTAKRRLQLPDPDRPHLGFVLVERLNIATVAGLPLAFACHFLANRLLPVRMDDRATWEVHAFFIGWGAALLIACVQRPRRAWLAVLMLGAAAFAALPVVDELTTERGLLPSLARGDGVFVGFDLTMLSLAAGLGIAAWKLYRRPAGARRKHAVIATGADA